LLVFFASLPNFLLRAADEDVRDDLTQFDPLFALVAIVADRNAKCVASLDLVCTLPHTAHADARI